MLQAHTKQFNLIQSNTTADIIDNVYRLGVTFVVEGNYEDIIIGFKGIGLITYIDDETEQVVESYDLTIPGPIVDHRDGTFSVTMYALTNEERRIKELEARIAELEG